MFVIWRGTSSRYYREVFFGGDCYAEAKYAARQYGRDPVKYARYARPVVYATEAEAREAAGGRPPGHEYGVMTLTEYEAQKEGR
jgi:hypothetical protein